MRSGTGSERIVRDVVSGHASRVSSTPALFTNGARYAGPFQASAMEAALAQGRPAGSPARRSAVPGPAPGRSPGPRRHAYGGPFEAILGRGGPLTR
jgi:hypothetical protein